MIARWLAFAVLVALALPGGAARAQSASNRAEAAQRVRQGEAYFQRGDFDRALAEYQAAFDLSAEPLLIFDIALCHDRAGRPVPALQAFRSYLEVAPDGIVASEARADVARLTPIVEKILADRAAEEARQHDAAAQQAEAVRREEAERASERSRSRRMHASLYVMAAGAAVVAAGGATYLVGRRTSDRLAGPSEPDAYASDRNHLFLERDLEYAAFAVGGVAIATGLVLAYTARGRRDRPQVSAAITPGGAAVVVAWSR
ncbi:MAG: hypothetical protein E6J90_42635 [Deltaproteobacteria bacterium]|nr:MAG: hypothetical protein E6J91_48385 [Deltaproteobacteria bacterium]TMQ07719.1 MAG: hypothetical protein E6J90_42635 [Deltaproteobacteria bacterium]